MYIPRNQSYQEYYPDNYRREEFIQRQLPCISQKLPVINSRNMPFLSIKKRKNYLQQLKTQIYRKCELEKIYSRSSQLQPKSPQITDDVKKEIQKLKDQEITRQKLARQANNLLGVRLNMFGIEHMGRRNDLGIIYPKTQQQIKEEQEKQNQEWVNKVIKYKQLQALKKLKKLNKNRQEQRPKQETQTNSRRIKQYNMRRQKQTQQEDDEDEEEQEQEDEEDEEEEDEEEEEGQLNSAREGSLDSSYYSRKIKIRNKKQKKPSVSSDTQSKFLKSTLKEISEYQQQWYTVEQESKKLGLQRENSQRIERNSSKVEESKESTPIVEDSNSESSANSAVVNSYDSSYYSRDQQY